MSVEAKTWDVFIAYSTKDADILQNIVRDLHAREITYWLDEEQIHSGDVILQTIEKGLRASNSILLCFSKNQLQSGWCRAEYTAILRQYFSGTTQQKVYALLLDDVQESQLPGFGEHIRYIRYSGRKKFKKFLNALKKPRQTNVEPHQQSERSSHQKYQITAEDINRIRNEYKKAQEYHHSDPAACLITARRIAEDICRQMLRTETSTSPQGLMLYKLIQQLTRNQVLPHTIAAPLQVIQNYGNVGAHSQGQHAEHLTPDYVKPCVDSLGIVVKWYLERYSLPDRGGVEILSESAFPDQATPEPQEQQIRHFLPSFIRKQYEQKNFEGNFDALTMFVDAVGFTPMTEQFMRHGSEGAEVLAEVMNKMFSPLVGAVCEQGGFISVFAGDAFTAVFPTERGSSPEATILHGLACIEKIQNIVLHHGIHKTKFGQFPLEFKVGLSYGKVKWGIVGETKKMYFFRGEAIEACAAAEQQAERGDIIFDERLAQQLAKIPGVSGGDWNIEKMRTGAYRLHAIPQALQQQLPPPAIFQEEPLCHEVLAQFLPERALELKEVGEFRNIVSVFIGFQGFSSDEAFQAWGTLLLEHVHAYGGYLSQFDVGEKGNIVLCVFGAPVGVEDPVDRALECLWDVKQKLKASEPLAGLQFRVGIAYGMAYAGVVGGKQQCVYTCYSEIVNIAARLMQHANWGDMLVSQTVSMKTELFSFRQTGDVSYTGFSAPIPTYRVFRKKYGVRKRAFSETLVGRQQELQQLHERVSPIFNGKFAGVLYVYGEAGIGKSHLTDALRQEVAAIHDINWFLCPVDQIFRKPLNPFITFLSGYFELSLEFPEEQNKAHFEDVYSVLLETLDYLLSAPQEEIAAEFPAFTREQGEHLRVELLRTQSIIGALLGLRWSGSLWEHLDAKGKHENTLQAITSFFLAHSLFNPTVIEIEDGHWIDHESREVLDILTRHIKHAPIVILCISRCNDDGSRPNFGLKGIFEQSLHLDYFSASDVKCHAETELQGAISDELHALLVEKTKGNPFFVQQVIRHYKELEIIMYQDHHWRLMPDTSTIPDSIENILIARLDRLSAEVKEAVKTASVLGNEFEIRLLSAVLHRELRDNDPLIIEARQAKIWDIYKQILVIFEHALFRDAAYKMLLNVRRKELHQVAAEAIETLYHEHLEHYVADLAYHYEKAEHTKKAIEYFERAGDQAKAQYQNQLAIGFYDRLLAQLQRIFGSGEKISDTLLKKAEILELIGKWDECQQVCKEALRLSEQIDDKRRIGQAKLLLGIIFRRTEKYNDAMLCFEQVLHVFERVNEKEGIGRAFTNMGLVYFQQNEYDTAIACYKKALNIAKETGSPLRIAINENNIGMAYDMKKEYDEAMEWYQKSLRNSTQLGAKLHMSDVIANIGENRRLQGDYKTAMEYYEKALSMKEEMGDTFYMALVVGNMGHIYQEQDEYQKAIEKYDRAISILKALESTFYLCEFLIGKANALFSLQLYDEAFSLNEEGKHVAEDVDNKEWISQSHLLSRKIDAVTRN